MVKNNKTVKSFQIRTDKIRELIYSLKTMPKIQ